MKNVPRPHFMPVELKSGYYARNVGPLFLEEARAVCALAQAAPEMLDALSEIAGRLKAWRDAGDIITPEDGLLKDISLKAHAIVTKIKGETK